jgi:hypothetical protein
MTPDWAAGCSARTNKKGAALPYQYYPSNATGLSKQARYSCKFAILAIANVHGYFKTETHFGSSWLGPHSLFPFLIGFVLRLL